MLVYGSYLEESPKRLREKFSWDVPLVFFGMEQKFPCRQVVQDKSAGVMQAIEHLHRLGHKEIYMLFAYWANWDTDGRFEGFIKGMKKLGEDNPHKRMHIVTTEEAITDDGMVVYDQRDMLRNIREFLKTHPQCTAIVCGNDIVAMNVMHAAWEMGIKVPDELSVVGFDNIHTSQYTHPPLTTVAQPISKIVSAAWQMLLDDIENKNDKPAKVVIPSELVIRESTANVKIDMRIM